MITEKRVDLTGHTMRDDFLPDTNRAFPEFNEIVLNNLQQAGTPGCTFNVANNSFHAEVVNAAKGKSILLISPKGWQKVSVNLGLALLAGSLKSVGFRVIVLDLCYTEMSDETVVKLATEITPFIVGISAKTAQAKEALRIGKILRKILPDATYIIGGPHVTLNPDFFFKTLEQIFDYGIMSEGEIALTTLALTLATDIKEKIPFLKGVIWRPLSRREVRINNWKPPQDLSSLPYPDFNAIHNFNSKDFCYPIVSSRGCPYSCIYCCVNLLTGSKKWRSRPPEDILKELLFAHRKYGITQFEFWDDNFTLDMNRAKKFCRLLIETDIRFSWWCHNGIRADKIDRELADLMYKAGCTSVAFGIESGTPKVFDSIRKGEKLNDCVNAVQLLKNAGIRAVGYFIIGLPEDNLTSFINTVRFQRSLKLDHYTYGLLVPYPGTKVWDIVQEKGKFLLDITESQHFNDDLPQISFELSKFPPEDIIIAHAITRFFELFEMVEDILKKQDSGKINIMLLIDKKVSPEKIISLIYSLILFKKQIKIFLYHEWSDTLLTKKDDFNRITAQFFFNHSSFKNHVENKFKTSHIIVANKKFGKLLQVNKQQESVIFFLQLSNPISPIVLSDQE